MQYYGILTYKFREKAFYQDYKKCGYQAHFQLYAYLYVCKMRILKHDIKFSLYRKY